MSFLWIWAYTYLIVWWTYTVSLSWRLGFSIVPMILYPFGIALRDARKLHDMRISLKAFKEQMSNQKVSLAETFSGPIFQLTGLTGVAWIIYLVFVGDKVSFISEEIQY